MRRTRFGARLTAVALTPGGSLDFGAVNLLNYRAMSSNICVRPTPSSSAPSSGDSSSLSPW